MHNDAQGNSVEQAGSLQLTLVVSDPEVVSELQMHAEGEAREKYALIALRIGVLSLRQAQGRLDSARLREEGEELIAQLTSKLGDHERDVIKALTSTVDKYFDPQTGRFKQRLEELISGEQSVLAGVLNQKISSMDEQLSGTLGGAVGETSPLMKLLSPSNKEGLLGAIEGVVKRELGEARSETLAAINTALGMKAGRKEAAGESTVHGIDFEDKTRTFLESECSRTADILENVSKNPGDSQGSKVGDFVITIGPDGRAAGARIVVEAKARAKYTRDKALEEIKDARKNRNASVGLFVFASEWAPAGLEPLARCGPDIVLTWNPDDRGTDIILKAGLIVARAICFQNAEERVVPEIDILSIEQAVRAVQEQASALVQIRTWVQTIQTNSGKVLKEVDAMETELDRQVKILDEQLRAVKSSLTPKSE